MVDNWEGQVYRRSKAMKRSEQEEWRKLRREILYRDHYRCYRCEKHISNGRGLTPHHLLPRDEGGQDDPDNLIVLCCLCHDYAEIYHLRTLEQIRLSYEDAEIKEAKEKELIERQESFPRPDWHAWVYGGMRRSDIPPGIVHLRKNTGYLESG